MKFKGPKRDSTGLKIDKNNAWDADNKTMTDLRRGQNDDDAAVTLSSDDWHN